MLLRHQSLLTVCLAGLVVLLVTRTAVGLVLLAPPGSHFGHEGLTAIELPEQDEIVSDDSGTWWAALNSTFDQPPPPLEEGDITLEKDTLKRRHGNKKHGGKRGDKKSRRGKKSHESVDEAMIQRLTEELMSKSENIQKLPSQDVNQKTHRSNRQRRDTDSEKSRQTVFRSRGLRDSIYRSEKNSNPNSQSKTLYQNSVDDLQRQQGHRNQGDSSKTSPSSSSISSSSSLSTTYRSSVDGANPVDDIEVLPQDNQTSGGVISAGNITQPNKGSKHHRARRSARTLGRIRFSWLPSLSSRSGRISGPPEPPVIVQRVEKIQAKVGVLVVVENSIYRQYLQDNNNNHRIALARIRRYYGMIFSMIHQRFQTIQDASLSVAVTISGILIADRRSESMWMEQLVDWSTVSSHGRASVHTDRALRKFSKWVSSRRDLPEYDHAMVFTAYRLSSKQGVGLGGMAYLKAICDTSSGNAVSIVGDRGDFQCVKVATHELAHSLGASHDGDRRNRVCRPDQNYVMSPLTSHERHVLKNAFYFSPCSIRDMAYHLSKPTSKCVRDDPTVYYKYDLDSLPPGRMYNADVQCQLIFGKKSRFCGEGNLVDIMCGQLWCRDPEKDNGCRTNSYLTALPGTKCALGKTCHLGVCRVDTSDFERSRGRSTSTVNVIPGIPQPAVPSFRIRGSRKARRFRIRTGRGIRDRRRRRRSRCTADKNSHYCQGLIKLNPGGCRRKAIRQYCCATCRRLRTVGR